MKDIHEEFIELDRYVENSLIFIMALTFLWNKIQQQHNRHWLFVSLFFHFKAFPVYSRIVWNKAVFIYIHIKNECTTRVHLKSILRPFDEWLNAKKCWYYLWSWPQGWPCHGHLFHILKPGKVGDLRDRIRRSLRCSCFEGRESKQTLN